MKRFLLIAVVTLSACGGSAANRAAETPKIADADPFAVAESWAQAQASGGEVERLHKTKSGYAAVVVEPGAKQATLLTIRRGYSGWEVSKTEAANADYLWPVLTP